MRQRCRDPKSKDFVYYGGKGIKVCAEWDDFAVFRRWALTNGYTDALSIERRDHSADYAPWNCCWIPLAQQARNTSRNHRITFNGETKILTEWATSLGIESSLLRYRLKHWGISRALTTQTIRRAS